MIDAIEKTVQVHLMKSDNYQQYWTYASLNDTVNPENPLRDIKDAHCRSLA